MKMKGKREGGKLKLGEVGGRERERDVEVVGEKISDSHLNVIKLVYFRFIIELFNIYLFIFDVLILVFQGPIEKINLIR